MTHITGGNGVITMNIDQPVKGAIRVMTGGTKKLFGHYAKSNMVNVTMREITYLLDMTGCTVNRWGNIVYGIINYCVITWVVVTDRAVPTANGGMFGDGVSIMTALAANIPSAVVTKDYLGVCFIGMCVRNTVAVQTVATPYYINNKRLAAWIRQGRWSRIMAVCTGVGMNFNYCFWIIFIVIMTGETFASPKH